MYSNQIASAKWYSLLGMVLLVCLVLGLPSSAVADQAPWIILDQSGVKVTRERSLHGWNTAVDLNGARYAVIHTGSGEDGHLLEVSVDFQDGYKVVYPGHYPVGTTTPFTRLLTPTGGIQLVPLGTAGAINSTANLSIYGFVSMIHNGRRVIVFPSGVIAAIGANATVVVFPDGRNSGASTIGAPPHIQSLLQSLQAAFHSVPTLGGALTAVTVSNYTEPSLLSDEEVSVGDDKEEAEDFDQTEEKIECKELPPCCCESPAADGTCRDFDIVVHGAGSGADGDGTSAGKILADMKSRPCHANAFSFVYRASENRMKAAERLARFSNKVAQACGEGSTGRVSGVCYGGYMMWHAMKLLDTEWFKWKLQFWNTPFGGGYTSNVIFTNLLSFGIINIILDRNQFNVMYGTLEPGPSTVPAGIKIKIHIGDTDAFLSQQSQRGPLNGPNVSEQHHDEGHFGTARKFYEYVECCGDEKVNNKGEECDPPLSECGELHSDFPVSGLCNPKCECVIKGCGNGKVDEEGEECESPGSGFYPIQLADGGCAIGFCTADCKVPTGPRCETPPNNNSVVGTQER